MKRDRSISPLSQIKKCKASKLLPLVKDNTSTKCMCIKTSEPGGLVPNWKKNTSILSPITCKNPIEFKDDKDDLIEGEFDIAKGSDMLSAVRVLKPPTVRVETKLVCDHHI